MGNGEQDRRPPPPSVSDTSQSAPLYSHRQPASPGGTKSHLCRDNRARARRVWGAIFIFRSKQADRLKITAWDESRLVRSGSGSNTVARLGKIIHVKQFTPWRARAARGGWQ
jgi:hypothetical protein